MSAELPTSRERMQKPNDWYERQKLRERLKLVGVLVIAMLILLIAVVRFGKTIPWGAR